MGEGSWAAQFATVVAPECCFAHRSTHSLAPQRRTLYDSRWETPKDSMKLDASPSPGTLVDGRYRLVDRCGEGTFGDLWRAVDTRLSDRRVAVKFLRAAYSGHDEAVARFGTRPRR